MKQNKIIYCYYQRLRHHSVTSKRLLKENYELREYYYRIQSKYYTRLKDKFENNKKRIQFFVGMVAFLSLSPVYNYLQGFEKYKNNLGFKIKSLIYGQELFLHPCFVEHNFKPNIDQELLKTFREIDELMPIGFTYQYVQSVCECLNIPHIQEQQNKSISPKQFDSFFKNIDTQSVIQAIKQVQNKELQSQMRMLK
ncbi:hypothetical protein pb186bvf_018389 [Paramecium bursaria]